MDRLHYHILLPLRCCLPILLVIDCVTAAVFCRMALVRLFYAFDLLRSGFSSTVRVTILRDPHTSGHTDPLLPSSHDRHLYTAHDAPGRSFTATTTHTVPLVATISDSEQHYFGSAIDRTLRFTTFPTATLLPFDTRATFAVTDAGDCDARVCYSTGYTAHVVPVYAVAATVAAVRWLVYIGFTTQLLLQFCARYVRSVTRPRCFTDGHDAERTALRTYGFCRFNYCTAFYAAACRMRCHTGNHPVVLPPPTPVYADACGSPARPAVARLRLVARLLPGPPSLPRRTTTPHFPPPPVRSGYIPTCLRLLRAGSHCTRFSS